MSLQSGPRLTLATEGNSCLALDVTFWWLKPDSIHQSPSAWSHLFTIRETEAELPGKIKRGESRPRLNTERNKLAFDPLSKTHSGFSQMGWLNPKNIAAASPPSAPGHIFLSWVSMQFFREKLQAYYFFLQLWLWGKSFIYKNWAEGYRAIDKTLLKC